MDKRIIILIVSLMAITGIIVGVSYAFFSVGGSQEQANTFTSGCLNISLTSNSASINLTNTYPITDIEGLETTSYDFTIENTCNTATNYSINLESLNKQTNSLSADYLKVALSSDTVDNVISKLSSNTSVTPEIDGAYESYNLYTGTLKGEESKTYHLKLWIDYGATKEQAANKVYQSKINVIANPETTVVDTLEANFEIDGTTVTSTLIGGVTSASYCTTTNNICTPTTNVNISNNSYTVEVESKEENQMVCTKLDETSKTICSNVIEGVKLCPEGAEACNAILAGKEIKTRNLPLTTSSKVEDTTTGVIYKAQDDWGDTYYFAGNPTDNWVKFANFYWRIIRINGDGSIRMIYQGTSANTTGTGTQLQTNVFNSSYNRSEYVGYMYTSGQQHGNTTDSPIKDVLDSWYSNNLASYADKISKEAGFCGDREMASGYSWSSQPSSTIYYAGYGRLVQNSSSVNPTFKCSNSNDLYTTSSSSKGNKKLTNPIGLITADEVIMAGGAWNSGNSSYYLYNNANYWTMSPFNFSSNGYAYVFCVSSASRLSYASVDWTSGGVRPVINIASDVEITGSGTSSDPYIVVEN